MEEEKDGDKKKGKMEDRKRKGRIGEGAGDR